MEEAQYLADRVAIIARGEIVAEGALLDLIGHEAVTTISFANPDAGSDDSLPEAVREIASVINGRVVVETREPTALLHALTSWASERSLELEGLSVAPRTLEDVYLQLTAEPETHSEPEASAVGEGEE
jgi:ABC-2 type transport system ATP-binding protein